MKVIILSRADLARRGDPLSGIEILGIADTEDDANRAIDQFRNRLPLPTEVQFSYLIDALPADTEVWVVTHDPMPGVRETARVFATERAALAFVDALPQDVASEMQLTRM